MVVEIEYMKLDEDEEWNRYKCFFRDISDSNSIYADFYMRISKKVGIILFEDREGGIQEFANALIKDSDKEWEEINRKIDEDRDKGILY